MSDDGERTPPPGYSGDTGGSSTNISLPGISFFTTDRDGKYIPLATMGDFYDMVAANKRKQEETQCPPNCKPIFEAIEKDDERALNLALVKSLPPAVDRAMCCAHAIRLQRWGAASTIALGAPAPFSALIVLVLVGKVDDEFVKQHKNELKEFIRPDRMSGIERIACVSRHNNVSLQRMMLESGARVPYAWPIICAKMITPGNVGFLTAGVSDADLNMAVALAAGYHDYERLRVLLPYWKPTALNGVTPLWMCFADGLFAENLLLLTTRINEVPTAALQRLKTYLETGSGEWEGLDPYFVRSLAHLQFEARNVYFALPMALGDTNDTYRRALGALRAATKNL